MIELPGPTGWAPSSTVRDARSGSRSQPVEATVVEPSEREDYWAVRVEIVKSRPPSAAYVRSGALLVNNPTIVDAPVRPDKAGASESRTEPVLSASVTAAGEATLSTPARFDVPDLRRAVAAYGAQSAAQDTRMSEATGRRLRIRA